MGFSLSFHLLVGLNLLFILKVGNCAREIAGPVPRIGSVVIDGEAPIASIDDDFICATLDWWPPEKCDYGTCSWGRASLLNLDLNNTILLNAIKAFSPLKLRLGGSLQDKLIYGLEDPSMPCPPFMKNSSEMFGFTQGCLPMSRWDELNDFFKKAGAVIIFGLNALNGRTLSGKSSIGPWNSSNAAAFMAYSVKKGYNIYAWELGNELSGDGVGTKVYADRYATDVIELHSVVDKIYVGSKVKPQIMAPGGFFQPDWYKEFVDKASNSLDVVSHHIYNLGPGVAQDLVQKILDPTSLDGGIGVFRDLDNILKNAKTTAKAWVGEAGGAYNSGHDHITNTFVFSFWYLDQLGMASKYNTKTYCRQTLIGGNYGLLDTTTFLPNPDYYSALLWNQLMGRNVLSANFNGSKKLRVYAHCAKQSKGVVLLLINLDGNTTILVHPKNNNDFSEGSWPLKHQDRSRTNFSRILQGPNNDVSTREEYHLTAKDGRLDSQTMLLNGKILAVDDSFNIPQMKPVNVDTEDLITVDPYSIVFAHIPSMEVPACG